MSRQYLHSSRWRLNLNSTIDIKEPNIFKAYVESLQNVDHLRYIIEETPTIVNRCF